MDHPIEEEIERLHNIILAKGVAFTDDMLTNQAEFYGKRAVLDANGATRYTNWVNAHHNVRKSVELTDKFYHETLRSQISGREVSYLDIGCADGVRTAAFLEQLRKYCRPIRYTAVDISSKMIEAAQVVLGLENLVIGDLCDLPFENEFDLVSCMYGVIGCLPKNLLTTGLNNLHMALKERGFLCIDFIEKDMVTFKAWGYTEDDEKNGRDFMAYYTAYRGNVIPDDKGRAMIGTARVFDPEQTRKNVQEAGFKVTAERRIAPFYKSETDFGTEYAMVLQKS